MKYVLIIAAAVTASVAASVGAVAWMERSKEQQLQSEIAARQALVDDARNQARLNECRDVIARISVGDRARAELVWGSNAEAAIDNCRNLIDLEEYSKR